MADGVESASQENFVIDPNANVYDQMAQFFMMTVANHEQEFAVVGALIQRCHKFDEALNWFCDELEKGNMTFPMAYGEFCAVLGRDNLMVASKNDLIL